MPDSEKSNLPHEIIDLSDLSRNEILNLSEWYFNTMTFSNDDRIFMVGGISSIPQGLYEISGPTGGGYNMIYSNQYAGYSWGFIDWSPDYRYLCFDKANSIIILEMDNFTNIFEIDEELRIVWINI